MRTEVTPKGEGTEANPYQITSIANLLWISNEADKENTCKKFYKLMNDIDASETQGWNNGAGFRPIGQDYSHSFQGTFDGNNKTITDLYINRTDSSGTLYVGMFGYASYATIKNLKLKNANISGTANNKGQYINTYVGALVGCILVGAITNCTASGTVTGTSKSTNSDSSAHVGGLTGENCRATITDCTASGNVTGESSSNNYVFTYVGGLVGLNYGAIINCTASGVTTVNGRCSDIYIGGLVGENYEGTITNCTASGTVTGESTDEKVTNIGGLVGENYYGTITNCTASASVTSTSTGGGRHTATHAGGLVGFNYGPITKCTALGNVTGSWLGETNQRNDSIFVGGLVGQNLRSKIDRCYSVGLVSSDYTDNVGGLIGMNERGSVVRSFWDMNTSGQETSSGGIGKTTEKMKRLVTYSK